MNSAPTIEPALEPPYVESRRTVMEPKKVSGPAPRPRRLSPRIHKWIRRAHLYLGLGLIPWVLLFGVSGFLFNHHSTFFGGSVRELASFTPRESTEKAGINPVDFQTLTQELVAQINEQSGGEFILADPGAVEITAHQRFEGRTAEGNVTLAIDLTSGAAKVTKVERTDPSETPFPLSGQRIETAAYNVDRMGRQAGDLLQSAGIDFEGDLTPSRRSPELRFQLVDADGRTWNTVYALNTGQVSGQAAEDETGLTFHSAVTRLHKTHHYPDHVNARWVWVAMADVTALTLVFWGLSGLVMWWKINSTRVTGTLAILFAVVAAAWVFSKTLEEHTFAPTGRGRPVAPVETASPPAVMKAESARPL